MKGNEQTMNKNRVPTKICPYCGDVVMVSFLEVHLRELHPGQSEEEKAPKKGSSKKIGPRPSPATKLLMKKVKRAETCGIDWEQEAKTLPRDLRKKKAGRKFWAPTSLNRDSSLFGGVKFSAVRICSGGLPGLGKKR